MYTSIRRKVDLRSIRFAVPMPLIVGTAAYGCAINALARLNIKESTLKVTLARRQREIAEHGHLGSSPFRARRQFPFDGWFLAESPLALQRAELASQSRLP